MTGRCEEDYVWVLGDWTALEEGVRVRVVARPEGVRGAEAEVEVS